MIISDLFSHKLHSSNEYWPQKLIDIATVFSRFDGQVYDRNAVEEAFKELSPRVSIVSQELRKDNIRDLSKYRDEISAYPAYLGLFRLERRNSEWILKLSETAKKFLIVEEPNVPAFLLLQLILFQYPNGSGVQVSGDNAWIVHNARDKTLDLIRHQIHISPLRLICKALLADSNINGIGPLHPNITIDELALLCNDSRLNRSANPSLSAVEKSLREIREGLFSPIDGFERRLHILNHTDFLQVTSGNIHLRESFSPSDTARQIQLLTTISNIEIEFNDFDNISSAGELNLAARDGLWGKYFDGITQLSAETVQSIVGEYEEAIFTNDFVNEGDDIIPDNSTIVFKYPLRDRDIDKQVAIANHFISKPADPEVTRIKRQKSNLTHKIILSKLDEHVRSLGASPQDNEHIDLFASIPNNGSYLFEVKSVSPENLLSQTRKAISQLYEYRYRYLSEIGRDVQLCLVYPSEPKDIDWLQDYLGNDRGIAVLWFEENKFCYSNVSEAKIRSLIPQ